MIYLCATPIGNLEDITQRAVRILSECDAVYAEDTRRSLVLLNHLGIKKPVFSCHEHNERQKAREIVARSAAGETVVVVSDAGMPGISDPGAAVVAAAIESGEPFTVLPGVSAVLTSAVLSGLPCDRFVFEGFLPREKKEREARIAQLKAEPRTAVLYESPFRLHDTLKELSIKLGESRCAAVCRELTKLHEECVRGTLLELAEHFSAGAKGECVIVLAGAEEKEEAPDLEKMLAEVESAVLAGERAKDAAKRFAKGISPSVLYNEYMKRRRTQEM
ncbi:MAG: 16S rRNA (cytidine(1402)-2'-O)-methyltransferase [Christensenellales bacterium]|jgi:16S rRNA (cytidine1402-2'-O)-methyltransferase